MSGQTTENEQKDDKKKSSLEKLDIVYFVKDDKQNEELRYSLRSVAENFPHRKVWIYGGKPDWCQPDEYVFVDQTGNGNKWDKVKAMIRKACINPEITDDFVLFNDDFFVMKPVKELPYFYRYSIFEHIVRLEIKYEKPTPYSLRLKETIKALDPFCDEINSYELHIPMILNKRKALEILGGFPNVHCIRTLYGNYQNIGGEKHEDVKVFDREGGGFNENSSFLSTEDEAFSDGEVGKFIREKFPKPCKFEAIPEDSSNEEVNSDGGEDVTR